MNPMTMVAAALVSAGTLSAGTLQEPAGVRVLIRTDAGDIEVEVDTVRAPVTATNFLRYVDAGSFTDGSFYRVVRSDNQPNEQVKIDVIQGGRARGTVRFPPIELERTNATGLIHQDGALSMARAGVDTATSEFFICVGAQPELDYGGQRNPDGQGFAVFGHVIRGMDVVHRIHTMPAERQQLNQRVRIIGMERIASNGPKWPARTERAFRRSWTDAWPSTLQTGTRYADQG